MPRGNGLEVGEVRLAGPLTYDSIVDGEGLRAVVFVQGCKRHCRGCHNPETWDLCSGFVLRTDEIIEKLRTFKGQAGLTLSGGEPMLQAVEMLKIVRFAKEEMGWNVWCWTGFLHEDIVAGRRGATPEMLALLREVDVLMDGPFVLAERDLSLRFRGSRNQRLLRLREGEVVSVE